MKKHAGAIVAVMMLAAPTATQAAEGGAGFYLLGTRGPGAAILPPAGLFFQNEFYYYQGDRSLPPDGRP
ncbi:MULTISPECIES: hypothetical protein [unclassified Ensifer]|uniref:hypothetical protein n=1 Tax=unclassified Ensifer TaxID=2633371 RepID=UPI000812C7B2|nr:MULTISPECIES: hypothetical protein [unclassified Ensifer]OCP21253.1 hypothetical protein BC363_28525 [Ensifer sp. LC384]OCP21836.1 hypothetical protein BC361_26145 [Ensifer sp. LC54]